jgi:hypothetical protein
MGHLRLQDISLITVLIQRLVEVWGQRYMVLQ